MKSKANHQQIKSAKVTKEQSVPTYFWSSEKVVCCLVLFDFGLINFKFWWLVFIYQSGLARISPDIESVTDGRPFTTETGQRQRTRSYSFLSWLTLLVWFHWNGIKGDEQNQLVIYDWKSFGCTRQPVRARFRKKLNGLSSHFGFWPNERKRCIKRIKYAIDPLEKKMHCKDVGLSDCSDFPVWGLMASHALLHFYM